MKRNPVKPHKFNQILFTAMANTSQADTTTNSQQQQPQPNTVGGQCPGSIIIIVLSQMDEKKDGGINMDGKSDLWQCEKRVFSNSTTIPICGLNEQQQIRTQTKRHFRVTAVLD